MKDLVLIWSNFRTKIIFIQQVVRQVESRAFYPYFNYENWLFRGRAPHFWERGGNIIFFLKAQVSPLSPDISLISVSKFVIWKKKNETWKKRSQKAGAGEGILKFVFIKHLFLRLAPEIGFWIKSAGGPISYEHADLKPVLAVT